MASVQFTGANAAEVEEFSGGKIKHDAFDGWQLISADKLLRYKLNPGDYVITQDTQLLVSATPIHSLS